MRMNMRTKIVAAEPLRRKAKKKRLNLYIDEDVLKDAKATGVNLSAFAEAAIRAEIGKRWYEENKAAIDAFNDDIAKNGLWSDGLRLF
jgi:antitoxin CcdA